MMIKKITPYLFFLFLLTSTFSSIKAGEISVSPFEEEIYELVNLARLDPESVGSYLDVDMASLFSEIAPHNSFWSPHKWSLRLDHSLSNAAISHCLDMFERDYFSSVTPEGKGQEVRVVEHGYRPMEITEYISVFAMQNYIHPEKAFFELFRRYFLDEVANYKNGKTSIFDYQIRDLGVSFRSGKLSLSGKPTNVYVMVIIYGISENYLIADLLERKINLARNDHVHTLEYYGIDKQEAARAMDGFLMINLIGGLPPLFFNSSTTTPYCRLFEDNDPKYSDDFRELQTIVWEENISRKASFGESAQLLFEKLIYMENMEGLKTIFNFRANFAVMKLTQLDACENSVLVTVELTIGEISCVPNLLMGNLIMGNMLDGQEIEDFPAGVPGFEDICLILYNEEGKAISGFKTGSNGFFRMSQEPGFNTWEAWLDETLLTTGSYVAENRSLWQDIVIPGFW